ncbi:DUF1080 domain-containing protein [Paenibacillus sp. IB182496]|uniref:DUF1080 domain-containing protein n=1 Tax=Paenibacillus sabuli TaxID=2772509 RepID=A0A927BWG7_9BACL|nr:family 16 glycoside hydrolase [Paenibacillus sabuli]MBD2847010.1 DUF1080 domain-containing protein [Paenibacillus sabuli]
MEQWRVSGRRWRRATIACCLAGLLGLGVPLPRDTAAAFGPAEWTVTEFSAGGTTTSSTVTEQDGEIELTTNGWNVWGAADGAGFVSEPMELLHGACSIVGISGTLESVSGIVNSNAAAGLMYRESLDGDAKNVMLRMQNGALLLTYRSETGGQTQYKRGATLTLPVELKLVRQGNTFAGYYKQDGAWMLSNYVEVAMEDEGHAGLAAYSADATPIEAVYTDIETSAEHLLSGEVEGYTDTEPIPEDLLLRERFQDGSVTNGPVAVNNPIWGGTSQACLADDDGDLSWRRSGANGIVYTGERGWTDYSASVDIRLDDGSINKNLAQLIVRGRTHVIYGEFYYAIGYDGSNRIVIDKAFRNTVKRLKTTSIADAADGQWRTLKVEAMDHTLKVYLDDVLVLEHTDEAMPNLRGGVGLRTEDSAVQFDNLLVFKLDDPLGGDYDNLVGGNFDQPAPPGYE